MRVEPLPVAETIFVTRSHLDIIIDMIKSQGTFVANRIPKSEQPVFLATINEIVDLCRMSIDMPYLITKLNTFREEQLKPKNLLFRMVSNPVPTKTLAFDLAHEVVQSVHVRFIDGGSKTFIGLLEAKLKAKTNEKEKR